MRILISTGIYPPKIGGPAQYALNLKKTFEGMGHWVGVATFNFEKFLPSGLRHLFFFVKLIPKVVFSDVVFVLDTFSVGFPTTLLCKILRKKSIIRTGGDFLWEQYVERTGKKVLFREFYDNEKGNFSIKEKMMFSLTKWTLLNTNRIIFSTEWQRGVFIKAYGLKLENTVIVENYYGPKEENFEPNINDFVASTRDLVWKNLVTLKRVFDRIRVQKPNLKLFTKNLPFEEFMEQIKSCYAVVLVSLGDISPNMILDSIRYNKPFICTKEVGVYDRIKDLGLFVDPLNEREIEETILKLLDKAEYEKVKQKVSQFNFVHTWDQISKEFLDVYNSVK